MDSEDKKMDSEEKRVDSEDIKMDFEDKQVDSDDKQIDSDDNYDEPSPQVNTTISLLSLVCTSELNILGRCFKTTDHSHPHHNLLICYDPKTPATTC